MNKQPTIFKDSQPLRHFLLNFLIASYYYFLDPLIFKEVETMIGENRHHEPNIVLGVFLIVVVFSEVLFFLPKARAVAFRLDAENKKMSFGLGFFLWMFHTVVSILMVMTALHLLGRDPTNLSTGESMVLFFVVIKDLVLLFMMMGVEGKKVVKPHVEFICDVGLLVFSCLAFSCTWEMVNAGPGAMIPAHEPLVLKIVLTFTSALIFTFFYFPARMLYYLEEIAHTDSREEWIYFLASLGVLYFVALKPLLTYT